MCPSASWNRVTRVCAGWTLSASVDAVQSIVVHCIAGRPEAGGGKRRPGRAADGGPGRRGPAPSGAVRLRAQEEGPQAIEGASGCWRTQPRFCSMATTLRLLPTCHSRAHHCSTLNSHIAVGPDIPTAPWRAERCRISRKVDSARLDGRYLMAKFALHRRSCLATCGAHHPPAARAMSRRRPACRAGPVRVTVQYLLSLSRLGAGRCTDGYNACSAGHRDALSGSTVSPWQHCCRCHGRAGRRGLDRRASEVRRCGESPRRLPASQSPPQKAIAARPLPSGRP